MKPIRSLLLLGALALAGAVHAADALDQIKSSGVFKIGTEGTYAPFSYHDTDGTLTGFDVEIGAAIAQRLGVKAEFVEGKWDGLIAGIDVKRYDAVINEVSITDARKAKYDFSEPYIASKAVLVAREDDDSMKSFADLKGKRSANTLTSNFGKLAEKYGAEVVSVQGFNDAVELVLSGRADVTINDSLSFLDFKKHQPKARLKIVAAEADADHAGVLIRKDNPELLAAINKALADMKADGTYQAISQKYFGADVSQ
ncbi:amino acid ABC transporter substrate-binding protein [Pokkaliibacter plantistimulans]|uniref:Amino acid ABC transporter substrate-binding protein n=1 Tax=Proteobacteria bacterium 228 TaxID=2083153 RepID=A0A2S5KU72_9PROT|nr:amino acid ABC transporter substrate-binding protein [Pokkaliibacter plantistimulans]PPC78263.1 amino acid ABC transporter substrate-binding protein [Pokkaliibacter plantistimulans]